MTFSDCHTFNVDVAVFLSRDNKTLINYTTVIILSENLVKTNVCHVTKGRMGLAPDLGNKGQGQLGLHLLLNSY